MSEIVDAMKLTFSAPRKYERPIALCRECEAPLVSTFHFPGAEFYCLDCGATCSFVSPKEGDPDDADLHERMERYEREWAEASEEEKDFEAWIEGRKSR